MNRKDKEPPKRKSLLDLLNEEEAETNKELEELKKRFDDASRKLLDKYEKKDKE